MVLQVVHSSEVGESTLTPVLFVRALLFKCYRSVARRRLFAFRIRSVPPDHCGTAPFFVTMYLCFNLVYNVVLIVILKYGR